MSAVERNNYRDGRLEVRQAYWDMELCNRHRTTWGKKLYASDVDRILSTSAYEEPTGTALWEYVYKDDMPRPLALIEYKHNRWLERPNLSESSLQLQVELANGYASGPLPALIAVYWPEEWGFIAMPLNQEAREVFGNKKKIGLTEKSFVRKLYQLRGIQMSKAIEKRLSKVIPNDFYTIFKVNKSA